MTYHDIRYEEISPTHPPSLACTQGDGISYETLSDILDHMRASSWSADNVAFGSGGALLQKLHRDTQKCAYKCSYAVINGEGVSVCMNANTLESGHLLEQSLEFKESSHLASDHAKASISILYSLT